MRQMRHHLADGHCAVALDNVWQMVLGQHEGRNLARRIQPSQRLLGESRGLVLHCTICLFGVCCEVWCHANRQLARPEDAVYLPRSIISNPDDGGDENSDKICHG